MIQIRHIENSDNLRPLKLVDQSFGRAAVRFANMMEDGTSLSFPGAIVMVHRNLAHEYQSWSAHRSALSIERAKRQFSKGNLTLAEYDDIIQRCHAALAKGGGQ